MYNKVKLSKRQIKEDKFTTIMLTSKQYASENWQLLVIGVAVLVLVVAAVVYMINSSEAQNAEASTRFSRALLDYRNGNSQVAIMSFSQILDDHGDTEVAARSTFLLGKINYDIRNYAEAIRYFEMYVQKYHDDHLNRAASFAGIAASHENQGQFAEAAGRYVEAFGEYPDGPLNGDYLLGVVRNYLESGNIQVVEQYMDTISERLGGTGLEIQAKLLVAEKNVK